MDDFPSNSKKAVDREQKVSKRAERPKLQPVTTGEKKKKPLGRRFAESFGGGDARGVVGYVMLDVLIPAAKDAVSDAVSMGVERMLFGEVRPSNRRSSSRPSGPSGVVNYNGFASTSLRPNQQQSPPVQTRRGRSSHQVPDVIVESRAEADEVLNRLYDALTQYEVVTLVDFYSLVSITPQFTDENWGWYRLDGARVHRARGGGYLIELPPPEPLS